jgi:hypothetical protein
MAVLYYHEVVYTETFGEVSGTMVLEVILQLVVRSTFVLKKRHADLDALQKAMERTLTKSGR